jgi:hypothetical protein
MPNTLTPSLYEVNTRVVLAEKATELGRAATFDDLSDTWLDEIASAHFDYVWMLGVWSTGTRGREVSRTRQDWRNEYHHDLPDFTDADISGSPFAIRDYRGNPDFGGEASLARLRARLKSRGVGLVLDFVPNHVAIDHPWVEAHPEFFIETNQDTLNREPQNYLKIETSKGTKILAHGRDPYFPGWPDTLQLDYRNPGLRAAMKDVIVSLSDRCDGLRCDMAMLVLPEVIARTWGTTNASGHHPEPFWPEAIAAAKSKYPRFRFMAEVYWGLEWTLMGEGFDYTYDKTLYDALRERNVRRVRGHMNADLVFQSRCVRFLENHDEPRAADVFPPAVHKAAAILTYLIPGMRFFHEGQFEGRTKRASNHLSRRADEPIDFDIKNFYENLLRIVDLPIFATGKHHLIGCNYAWEGNPTWENFVAIGWESPEHNPLVIVVNFSDSWSQCFARVLQTDATNKVIRFADQMSDAFYDRDGTDLGARGLFLDMPPWGYHVFEVTTLD